MNTISRKVALFSAFLLLTSIVRAQIIGAGDGSNMSPQTVEPMKITKGHISDDVNLLTGTFNASYVLGSVTTPSGPSFTLTTSYSPVLASGGVTSLTGGIPYGEGWSLNIPTVSVSTDFYKSLSLAEECNPSPGAGAFYTLDDRDIAKEGDPHWMAPQINIPGVFSGRVVFKCFEDNAAVFVPHSFDQYIEARFWGSHWEIFTSDGTIYKFAMAKKSLANPNNQRFLNYGSGPSGQLDDVHDQYDSGSTEPDYNGIRKGDSFLPKEYINSWFCTSIDHPNTYGQQISFSYEKYGEFNFFKEFQDQDVLHWFINQFFGRDFMGYGASLPSMAIWSDIHLTSISSSSANAAYERVELNYASIPLVGSKNMLDFRVVDSGVERKDSLYSSKIEVSIEDFEGWRRFYHVKADQVPSNSARPSTSNPYYDSVNDRYYYDALPDSDEGLQFDHGFLESPRIGVNQSGDGSLGFNLISGDLYDFRTTVLEPASEPGMTVDINLATGGWLFDPSSDGSMTGSEYKNSRGRSIYSTFGNMYKWFTKGSNSLNGNETVTSNLVTVPYMREAYEGFNFQVGPGSTDIMYDIAFLENNPLASYTYVDDNQVVQPSAYRAYWHMFWNGVSNTTTDGSGFVDPGMRTHDPLPSNFGLGLPPASMIKLHYNFITGLTMSDDIWDDDNFNFWHSVQNQPWPNIPTRASAAKLTKFEVERFSKNPYMLKSVSSYVYNGVEIEEEGGEIINVGEKVKTSQLVFDYGIELDAYLKDHSMAFNNSYQDLDGTLHGQFDLTLEFHDKAEIARNVFVLKSISEVPVDAVNNAAPSDENIDTSVLPKTQFEYSRLQDLGNGNILTIESAISIKNPTQEQIDFVTHSGMYTVMGSEAIVLTQLTDRIGGVTDIEYYDIQHEHTFNVARGRRPSTCATITEQPISGELPGLVDLKPTVKSINRHDGDVNTDDDQIWNYEYYNDQSYINEHNKWPLEITLNSANAQSEHFRQSSIKDYNIGFQKVTVRQPVLDDGITRPYAVYHYLNDDELEDDLRKTLLFGKMRKQENFNSDGVLISEDVFDYDYQLAFESGFSRPNNAKDRWRKNGFDYMDYYFMEDLPFFLEEPGVTLFEAGNTYWNFYNTVQIEEQGDNFMLFLIQIQNGEISNNLPVNPNFSPDDEDCFQGNPGETLTLEGYLCGLIGIGVLPDDFDIVNPDLDAVVSYYEAFQYGSTSNGTAQLEAYLLELWSKGELDAYLDYIIEVSGDDGAGGAIYEYGIQNAIDYSDPSNNYDFGPMATTMIANFPITLPSTESSYENLLERGPGLFSTGTKFYDKEHGETDLPYYQSFFTKLSKKTHREFDATGLVRTETPESGGGAPDENNEVALNPVGVNNTNNNTNPQKTLLLDLILNETDEQIVADAMLLASPLEDDVLVSLINRGNSSLNDIVAAQPVLSNAVLLALVNSTTLDRIGIIPIVKSKGHFGEDFADEIIRYSNTYGKQFCADLLKTQAFLSTDMLELLVTHNTQLGSNNVVDIIRQQPTVRDNILITLFDNHDVDDGSAREILIKRQGFGDVLLTSFLGKTPTPSEHIVKSILTNGNAYPSETILTTLVNDPTFSRKVLGDILLNSPKVFTDPFLAALTSSGISPEDLGAIQETQEYAPWVCGELTIAPLAIENITEYEYYDADPHGRTTSNGYKKLMGIEEIDEIYLKWEPSWQIYKQKDYSPQTPGAYSEQEYFYYYDLKNRYDRHFISSYYSDHEYASGLQEYEVIPNYNIQWFKDGVAYEMPEPDGMLLTRSRNMLNLVFEHRTIGKNTTDSQATVKSNYYYYDADWNDVPSPTEITEEGFFDFCAEDWGNNIVNENIDVYGGGTWDPNKPEFDDIASAISEGHAPGANDPVNRSLPTWLKLRNRLYLRNISTQVDTIYSENKEFLQYFNDEYGYYYDEEKVHTCTDPLMDFRSIEDGDHTNIYDWLPIYPYDHLQASQILTRNANAQVEIIEDAEGLKTKYEWPVPFLMWYVNLNEGCGPWQESYTKNEGLPISVTVGYDSDDRITTYFDYHIDKSLKSVTDANGMVASNEFDEYGRLSKVFQNDNLLKEYKYNSWVGSSTDSYMDKTTANYVESLNYYDNSGETHQSRAFIDPYGRNHSSWTRIAHSSGINEDSGYLIYSGQTDYDQWNRPIKQYKPFAVFADNDGGQTTIPRIPLLNQDVGETTLWNESQYEDDQRSRPLRQSKPGLDINVDPSVNFEYEFINGLEFVCDLNLSMAEANDIMGADWADCIFRRQIVSDEDDKTVTEYSNTLGQKVATKQIISEYSVAITLFQFDSNGNVTKVINPEKQESKYLYNILGNMYQKETVDGGKTKYMYNKRGQVTLEQDKNGSVGIYVENPNYPGDGGIEGEMVPFYRKYDYDSHGRLITQTRVASPDYWKGHRTFDPLEYADVNDNALVDANIPMIDHMVYVFTNRSTLSWLAEANMGVDSEPSEVAETVSQINLTFDHFQPEKEFYYARYDGTLVVSGLANPHFYPLDDEFVIQEDYLENLRENMIGKLSYSRAFHVPEESLVYDPDEIQVKYYSYNDEGQIKWELQQFNHNGITATDKGILMRIDYPDYDFAGNLLTQNIDFNSDQNLDLQYHFDYDGFGRLTSVFVNLDNSQDQGNKLLQYTYNDALGLVTKTDYFYDECDDEPIEVHSTEYLYDDRDRLNVIEGTLYTQNMFYDNNWSTDSEYQNIGHDNNWNGNINGILSEYNLGNTNIETGNFDITPVNGDIDYDAAVLGYVGANEMFSEATMFGYQYDDLNRLTTADALVGNTVIDIQTTYGAQHNGDVKYHFDRIGNFTMLERWINMEFADDEASVYRSKFMYDYFEESNILTSINNYGLAETGDRTYTYDRSGNLLTDSYRKLVGTTYGRANLPVVVEKDTYDAQDDLDKVEQAHYYYDDADLRIAKEFKNGLNSIMLTDIYWKDAFGRDIAVLSHNNMDGNDQTTWTYYTFGNNRFAKIQPNTEQAPSFYLTQLATDARVDQEDEVTQQIIAHLASATYPMNLVRGLLDGTDEVVYLESFYQDVVDGNPNFNFVLTSTLLIRNRTQLIAIDRTGQGTLSISVDDLLGGGTGDPTYRSPTVFGEYTYLVDKGLPKPSFYVHDHLGNTRVVFKPYTSCTYGPNGLEGGVSRVVEEMADYYPYAKILRRYVSPFGPKEKYFSTHHERDEETELDYRGARFYDSDIGRFLSLDPLAIERISMSAFNYVSGNPVTKIDPTGLLDTKYEGADGSLLADTKDGNNATFIVSDENKDKFLKEYNDAKSKGEAGHFMHNQRWISEYGESVAPVKEKQPENSYSEAPELIDEKTGEPLTDGHFVELTASFIPVMGASVTVGKVYDSNGSDSWYFRIAGGVGVDLGLGLNAGIVKEEGDKEFTIGMFEGRDWSSNVGIGPLSATRGGDRNGSGSLFQFKGKNYTTSGGWASPSGGMNSSIMRASKVAKLRVGGSYQWGHTSLFGN